MAKFGDRKSVGISKIVPFIPGEGAKERHERRLTTNLNSRQILEEWCANFGIQITITNNNHHWRFFRGKVVVEWWPSSAKFVANHNYRQGIHVHDYRQVAQQLTKFFGITDKDTELILLYREMYELTEVECRCSCKLPHSCCSPEYCQLAAEWAKKRWNVDITPLKTKHPNLPFMGEKGCVLLPHFRPLCTVHTCDVNYPRP